MVMDFNQISRNFVLCFWRLKTHVEESKVVFVSAEYKVKVDRNVVILRFISTTPGPKVL